MKKMDEADLLALLNAEEDSAYQYNTGVLAEQREQALKEYLRLPYGNEEEGRSSVVTSDVFDAVEGMLPDLLDVFVASDEAVRFDPTGPEDEEGAKQASDSCNYVFYKQNNGFLLLYTAGKDALQLKTGGVKWWWDVRREASFTSYKGVDEMQLALFLATNPNAEVVEKEEREEPQQPQMDPMTGQMVELPPKRVLDVKIKTVAEKGKVKLCNIPPDELLVSKKHNSILLDECPYVAHIAKRTLSDIQQMGFDVTVDEVKAASDNEELSVDRELRDNLYDGQRGWWRNTENDHQLDDSMVEGWLKEEYVLVDFDGDGIAERRRIMRLGDKILENKEVSHVQIAAWTPYILQHRFHGLSVADLVSDFQRIGTEIWRQSLDNLYLANNQETVVLTDAQGNPQANIDDVLNRTPGGIMREKVQGAIRPYMEQWQGIQAQPMIEQLQVAKENRTGWTRYSQGLDSNSLNKTMGGMSMIMNASQKRMKLMARIMAEALVAPMFRGIFKTLTDYCMDKLSFRLNGKFVQYDPQEWRDGYDMTVNVGLGTGERDQQLMHLNMISQAQQAAMAGGGMGLLVTPQNIFNTQKRIVENAGYKNVEEFWTDPQGKMPPPPQPDPKIEIEKEKVKQDGQYKMGQLALEHKKLEMDGMKTDAQIRAQRDIKAAELLDKGIDRDVSAMHQEQEKEEAEKPKQEVLAAVSEQGAQLSEILGALQQSVEALTQAIQRPRVPIRNAEGRAVGARLATDEELAQMEQQ